jgi:hypothetical protein
MDPAPEAHRYQRGGALLVATIACLLVTIAAGYRTRLAIGETGSWVAHTHEVKVAIVDCELALLRDDGAALSLAEANVARLTVDNPLQQRNVARAVAGAGSRDELEKVFVSMRDEEDRLMTVRLRDMASAGSRSSLAFIGGAVLTLVFGAGAFSFLYSQGRSLSSAHDAVSSTGAGSWGRPTPDRPPQPVSDRAGATTRWDTSKGTE